MSGNPDFEIIQGHDFKPKEKVMVIDPNGYDLWEGVIISVKPGKYSIHYPEFDDQDEELEDVSRLLVNTRKNRRIFNQQEARRQTQLPALPSGGSEPFSDRSDDDDDAAGDYAPDAGPGEKKKSKKSKKAKEPKKSKAKDKSKPRPEGARVSPRRGGSFHI
jgi:hypothetical protein